MSNQSTEQVIAKEWQIINKYLRKASLTVFLCVFVIVFCLFFFKINTAAVAPGQVVIDFNKKTVQHLEGGIVKEILVKNGDIVKQGQELIRLSEVQGSENLKANKYQLENLKVEVERIKSQINNSNIDLKSLIKEYPEKIIELQMSIAESEKMNHQENLRALSNQIADTKQRKIYLQEQRVILQEKLSLLQKENKTIDELYKSNNTTRQKMIDSLKQTQEAKIALINNESEIAKTSQSITEINMKIQNLNTEYRRNLQNKLSEDLRQLQDAEKQYNNSKEVNQRLVVIAPVGGMIRNIQVFTIGGVLRSGQDLLDIVPQSDDLLVEVKIEPKDIDVVHLNMSVIINFSALQSKIAKKLSGKLIYLDPDITKEQNGRMYYIARIKIDPKEKAKINNFTLYPGMQVEAFIVVGKKSFATILFEPLLQQINKSFRDA